MLQILTALGVLHVGHSAYPEKNITENPPTPDGENPSSSAIRSSIHYLRSNKPTPSKCPPRAQRVRQRYHGVTETSINSRRAIVMAGISVEVHVLCARAVSVKFNLCEICLSFREKKTSD